MKNFFTLIGVLCLFTIFPFNFTFSQINQNCPFGVDVLDFSSLNGSNNAESDINAAGLTLKGSTISVANVLNGGATLSDDGINDDHLNGCIGANFGAGSSNGPTQNVVTTWTFSPALNDFCFRVLDIDRNDEIVVNVISNGTVYNLTAADITIPYTAADGPCISFAGNNVFTSICTPPDPNIGNTLRGAADICIPVPVDQLQITFYDKGATGGGSYTICQMEVCADPLPLELTSFTGRVNNCQADISWVTATEIDFSHFLLQKSIDGTVFTTLDRIDGTGGENAPARYTYTDHDQLVKHNFYRLAMVDNDGTVTNSSIIQLAAECAEGVYLSAVYPNPVKGMGKIRLNNTFDASAANLVITDMTGKVVRRYPVDILTGTNELELDATGISSGIYYVSFQAENWRSQYRKFVLY